ncbi:ABC transporter permease [Longispora sp. NPDC051575]|uniref:ABC transporter permease n=1 Tax=Longispora sp. NPDC051575 TaxID=3154943 RepID=UPI0034376B97
MAQVTTAAPVDVAPDGPGIGVFVRLKLRILRNGFQGKPGRVVALVFSLFFGVLLAAGGFALFASMGAIPEEYGYGIVALLGSFLVIGWIVMPVAMFGVDETLDPARFALLPIPKRRLMAGLLASAFLGVPAIATLIATAGLVVAGFVKGGPVAGVAAAVGVVLGVGTCVVGSRAVTSGFAAALRSRRSRDLALIGITLSLTLIGPMISLSTSAMAQGDAESVKNGMRIIGYSPLAAPFTAWYDLATGSALLGLAKLAGTAIVLALLARWWSNSLESAMVGAASGGAQARKDTGLPLRVLGRAPQGVFGAIVAAEMRGWWRDPRRRATLLSMLAASLAMPIGMSAGQTTLALGVTVVWIGVFLALAAGNQFGFGGSAYAFHLMIGVPGRLELRARSTALALLAVPALTVVVPVLGILIGKPAQIVGALGSGYAAFGVAIAIMSVLSVRAPYALPDSSNPFAMNSGGGCMKGVISLGSMFVTLVLASPMAVGSWLLGDSLWSVLLLPVGIAYGVGAAVLGARVGGDMLQRRGPEVLAAVTPGR